MSEFMEVITLDEFNNKTEPGMYQVNVEPGKIPPIIYSYFINKDGTRTRKLQNTIAGIDGSSVLDASLDEDGHLILTVQDYQTETDTTKMLTVESGVVTGQDILDIKNSINRLNASYGNISEQVEQSIEDDSSAPFKIVNFEN